VSREAAFLGHLRQQCAARAPLFEPAHESANVNDLVRDALGAGDEQPQTPRIRRSKRFKREEAQ